MNKQLERYSRAESIRLLNRYGRQRRPMAFLISFEGEENLVLPLQEAAAYGLHLHMPGMNGVTGIKNPGNTKTKNLGNNKPAHPGRILEFSSSPISREAYNEAFGEVSREILYGNSFLLNLTFSTPVECSFSMEEIYRFSMAPYKLLLKDELVIFSPEQFLKIEGKRIVSNPMKGTMDACLPGALEKLTTDPKEDAEHHTIVDLIRNDLSMVAKKVRVERFKYVEELRTHTGSLLQMSSEITGELPEDFHHNLGDILFTLLPAGSICGAPKRKTLEIIRRVESHHRGYYTGIFGYWDGSALYSAVAIRYIEKTAAGLIFKSGGGITGMSNCDHEYEEMKRKVYVPVY